MSLQQEHQEWQEQKAKQALDNSYNILEERNIAVPDSSSASVRRQSVHK